MGRWLPTVNGAQAHGDTEAAIADALRSGPFDHALHTAMQLRGLGLERVQRRLRDEGVELSLATLSYWRRGRSRPESARSLIAVRMIEQVLGLPADSLVTLIGPRKPRGRWAHHTRATRKPEEILGTNRYADIVSELNAPPSDCFRWLSLHDRCTLDERGAESRVKVSLVVQAEQDRLDRCLFGYQVPGAGQPLPVITAVHAGRLGRVRRAESDGVIVAELFFDRILAKGDTAVLEYEYMFTSAEPTDFYERAFRLPARQYTLEVQFHPSAVPVRCFHTARPASSAGWEYGDEVWISPSLLVHRVILDPPAACHGITWEWQ